MAHRSLRARPAAMSDVFYLILRRMRFPLILLLGVYSVCVAGFAMIPGTGPDGQPTTPMTLFEAFYVVSYTATTIGFGEVPRPFNAAQRLWMTMTIYVAVAAWTYSLLNLIALLQDRGFQNALRIARFSRLIYNLREPFYIVCGAGETGRLLCHGLDHLGLRFVVVEKDADRLQQLRMDNFSIDNPMIAADASAPTIITQAGLLNSHCKGVVALTEEDTTNQAIAVSVRLLNPRVPVLARLRDSDTETHIGAFGGDIVVNPFQRFAERLSDAISTPERYRLRGLLTGLPGEPVRHIDRPPSGHWIVCGYGRFGHAVTERLREIGMSVSVVDTMHFSEGGVDVKGPGSNSEELKAAGIDHAVGIVTGYYSDTKNLAIAVTARAMKRDIFVVNRQNQLANDPLFDAFDSDLVMVPSKIVAQEFIARITTPMLNRFLRLMPQHNEADCRRVFDRLTSLDFGRNPEVWDVTVSAVATPALAEAIGSGETVTVAHLMANPWARDLRMKLVVLLIRRGNTNIQLPDESTVLEIGDKLLLAGNPRSKRRLAATLVNINALNYLLTGRESNGGFLWRWLTRKNPPKVVPLPPPIAEDEEQTSVVDDLSDENDDLFAADDQLAGVAFQPVESRQVQDDSDRLPVEGREVSANQQVDGCEVQACDDAAGDARKDKKALRKLKKQMAAEAMRKTAEGTTKEQSNTEID